MKRSGAPVAEVAKVEEESERKSREQAEWVDRFLAKSKFAGRIGAFEGRATRPKAFTGRPWIA